MDIGIDTFIKLDTFSTGRRLFSLGQVQDAARTMPFPALVAHTGMAMDHDRETYQLDLLWAAQKSAPASVKGRAAAVDNQVDKTLSGLRDAATAQAAGAAEDEPIVAQVDRFLGAVFPSGVYAVTSLPHVEQLVAVESILHRLQGELAPLVTELALTRLVTRLARLTKLYRQAQLEPATQLAFATVNEARVLGQTYLVQTVAMILGRYYLDTPEHAAARAALLGPIAGQNESIRAYLSTRRAVRDVDPDTGELAGDLAGDVLDPVTPAAQDVAEDIAGAAAEPASGEPVTEPAA